MSTTRRFAANPPARRLAWALGFVLAANVGAGAQNNWSRIDTPSFVAIGDLPGSVLRDIVLRFEGFRETLGRLHGSRFVSSAVPTVIIAFPTDYAIGPFRPKFNGKPVDIAGIFVPGRDLNYIAIVNDGDAARLRIVFHEYTHLVLRNSGLRLPVWLSEGLAEYYSTFEPLKGGRVAIVGNVIDHHLRQLNQTVLIPIAELLTIDHNSSLYNEGSRRSVFYAQSWALVHMLLRAEPNRTQQLAAYVDRVSRGEEAVKAWQEAFGAVNVDQELDRYIRQPSFTAVKYGFGEVVTTFDAAATPMTPSEVQAFLADFQTERDEYDDAAARLAELAKRDPSSVRAGVTAVRLSLLQRRPADIGDRLRTMAPPSDWLLAYLAGVTLVDLISHNGTPSDTDMKTVGRLLDAARTSGHEFPNAVARAAELELRAQAMPSAETAAALDRARQAAPGRDDYTFLHVQILARRKEFAKARSLLGPLLALGPPDVRDAARRALGTIADYESALAAGRPPASAQSQTLSSTAAAGSTSPLPTRAREPATSTVNPIYRQSKPGEQRLEAVFEKIECITGQGITFYFKAGDRTVTATAARFDDVEFITYRSDLTGSIGCGLVKEPMRVYLTWRPGRADGSKVAVAIEFPPK